MGLPLTLLHVLAAAARPLMVAGVIVGGSVGIWRFALGGLAGTSDGPAALSLASEAPLVIYSGFGPQRDTLWAADPENPDGRVPLATVEHAEGYGVLASLSPDGARIAYTVLPPGRGGDGSGAPAELWLMGADGSGPLRLAEGLDLLVRPVWAPDSASILVRRSSPAEDAAGSFELLRVDLSGRAASLVTSSRGLFPVAFSPDGATVYYAEISAAGTDLGRVPAGGGTGQLVAHLSDDIARDWHLSPDGSRLAYLASREDSAGFSARVLDLTGGGAALTTAGALRALAVGAKQAETEFNPIWHPNGRDLTVGRLSGGLSSPALNLTAGDGSLRALAAPRAGFDVPLAWSPDGEYLAVRAFAGSSAASPGASAVVVVGADGRRQQLPGGADVDVVGWLP